MTEKKIPNKKQQSKKITRLQNAQRIVRII